jgi:hypothetical protein
LWHFLCVEKSANQYNVHNFVKFKIA